MQLHQNIQLMLLVMLDSMMYFEMFLYKVLIKIHVWIYQHQERLYIYYHHVLDRLFLLDPNRVNVMQDDRSEILKKIV